MDKAMDEIANDVSLDLTNPNTIKRIISNTNKNSSVVIQDNVITENIAETIAAINATTEQVSKDTSLSFTSSTSSIAQIILETSDVIVENISNQDQNQNIFNDDKSCELYND